MYKTICLFCSVSLCSGHLLASLVHVEVPNMFSHIASSTFSVGFNTILKYDTVTITDIQLHIPVQMSVSLWSITLRAIWFHYTKRKIIQPVQTFFIITPLPALPFPINLIIPLPPLNNPITLCECHTPHNSRNGVFPCLCAICVFFFVYLFTYLLPQKKKKIKLKSGSLQHFNVKMCLELCCRT